MENNIASALAIVAENAAGYTPKQECNRVLWEDADGNLETFEPLNCEDYCEDCIDRVLADATASPEIEKPEGFVRLCYETESAKENEGFCTCSGCGETIGCEILWTKQEVDHWLSLRPKEWAEALSLPSTCWEIEQVLGYSGACREFPVETAEIARRVVEAAQKQ